MTAPAIQPTKAYILVDPNWGEPLLDLQTAHETEYGARCAAELSPAHALYSGMHVSNGAVRAGSWDKMQAHGFRIVEVLITYVREAKP